MAKQVSSSDTSTHWIPLEGSVLAGANGASKAQGRRADPGCSLQRVAGGELLVLAGIREGGRNYLREDWFLTREMVVSVCGRRGLCVRLF